MKKEIETCGPAFPRPHSEPQHFGAIAQDGMTLRDYFAAKAMQGICSDNTTQKSDDETYEYFAKNVADSSYIFADAMLSARNG